MRASSHRREGGEVPVLTATGQSENAVLQRAGKQPSPSFPRTTLTLTWRESGPLGAVEPGCSGCRARSQLTWLTVSVTRANHFTSCISFFFREGR